MAERVGFEPTRGRSRAISVLLEISQSARCPLYHLGELTLPRTPLALVGSNPFPKPKRRTDPSGRYAVLAEGVGFEPTRVFPPSGFQDRPDSQVPCTPPRPL